MTEAAGTTVFNGWSKTFDRWCARLITSKAWCMGGPKSAQWTDWDADQVLYFVPWGFCSLGVLRRGYCARYEKCGMLETEHGNGEWYYLYMMADQFLIGAGSADTTTPAGAIDVITPNGQKLQRAHLMAGDTMQVRFAGGGKVNIYAV